VASSSQAAKSSKGSGLSVKSPLVKEVSLIVFVRKLLWPGRLPIVA
jgi:hypothetical protein